MEQDEKTLRYRLNVPEGYRVQIENRSGRELVRSK